MKRSGWPESEIELAKPVIQWLQDHKWEVYQEVQISAYGNIADIVAVQGIIVWIIECKRSLSIAAIGQAFHWKYTANYISIATPSRYIRRATFGPEILQVFGFGLLRVHKTWDSFDIHEVVRPQLNRKRNDKVLNSKWLRDKLVEPQKTFAEAGNPNGQRWTPFQETCHKILREVEKQPGLTMRELLERINTHYNSISTARTAIVNWAKQGVIDGVCVRYEGRKIRLFPTSTFPLDNEQNVC